MLKGRSRWFDFEEVLVLRGISQHLRLGGSRAAHRRMHAERRMRGLRRIGCRELLARSASDAPRHRARSLGVAGCVPIEIDGDGSTRVQSNGTRCPRAAALPFP